MISNKLKRINCDEQDPVVNTLIGMNGICYTCLQLSDIASNAAIERESWNQQFLSRAREEENQNEALK